jgi:hypothetical protein
VHCALVFKGSRVRSVDKFDRVGFVIFAHVMLTVVHLYIEGTLRLERPLLECSL